MNKNTTNDELLAAFQQSLRPCAYLSADLLQFGVKSIVEDELLKEIPFIKSVATLFKFGKNIHDRNLLNQTLTFIVSLNDGSISDEQLKMYQDSLAQNPQKLEKELGRIMLLLNRHIEYEQSKVLAKFEQAYIAKKITWEKLCELAIANERMFASDYEILQNIYKSSAGVTFKDYEYSYQIDRLVSLGLISKDTLFEAADVAERLRWDGLVNSTQTRDASVTIFGKLFCDLLEERAN